jgi:hypothetical protein
MPSSRTIHCHFIPEGPEYFAIFAKKITFAIKAEINLTL